MRHGAAENKLVNKLHANTAEIKSVKYVSKEAGLSNMRKTEPALTQGLGYNPLPDSLEVTPTKGEFVQDVAKSFYGPNGKLPPGVDSINDGNQLSKRILQVAHVIEAIFTVATLVLLIASTLLIANTIRLSIFSRRREIEVMKLVGATNWFVRGPFMIEGLLCGLGGSILAVFFLVLSKEIALPSILHGSLSGTPGVHALAFPLTSLDPGRNRPRPRRARLWGHPSSLPARLRSTAWFRARVCAAPALIFVLLTVGSATAATPVLPTLPTNAAVPKVTPTLSVSETAAIIGDTFTLTVGLHNAGGDLSSASASVALSSKSAVAVSSFSAGCSGVSATNVTTT